MTSKVNLFYPKIVKKLIRKRISNYFKKKKNVLNKDKNQ